MKVILRKGVLCSFVILNFLIINTSNAQYPTTRTTLDFEVTVEDSIDVGIEGAKLDFGNILKNSKQLQIAKGNIRLKTSADKEMSVTAAFRDGQLDGDYTKFELFKDGGTTGDALNVHIRNVEKFILLKGEDLIPITGEIREVGNITLGKYEKTIKVDLNISPVSPI